MTCLLFVSFIFLLHQCVSEKIPISSVSHDVEYLKIRNNFDQWITKFGKKYRNDQEYEHRYSIFKDNLNIIEDLNKKEGQKIYGITKFADLSPVEFRNTHLMPKFKGPTHPEKNKISLENIGDIPTDFDWRTKGAVTPVYDQGACGSCWAFSATEAIESQWFLSGRNLTELSPQQIVDCDLGTGDEGCNGGDTPTAYEYVMKAGGMETQDDYPYTGEDDHCSFKKAEIAAHISNWAYVTKDKNETEMMYALYAKGPLSICVDAATWQFYIGGVVSHWCGTDLDHCVVITGFEDYTTWDDVVKSIWLIRNSWGSDWGEDGYIYVERGNDLCGVGDEATLPIV